MQFIHVDKKFLNENASQGSLLIKQYNDLLNAQSSFDQRQLSKKNILFADESLLLLVDANKKVVAGASMKTGEIMPHVFADDTHLPAAIKHAPDCEIGHVTGMVAAKEQAMFLPGVVLQEKILQALNDNTLGVNIIVAHIAQSNTLPLYEASKNPGTRSGLKIVVRTDLNIEANTRGEPVKPEAEEHQNSGRAFFVAATNNPAIDLVPGPWKGNVMPEDQLAALAHREMLLYKDARHAYRAAQKDESPGPQL